MPSQSPADPEALLQAYRQRVLRQTREVDLRGLPEPVGRDGRRLALQMPLDRVYIRLQAVHEAQARRAEEEEQRRLRDAASDERAAGPETASERQGFLARLLGRRPGPEEGRPARSRSILSVLRTLGESFYHRGETYAAAQRPDPVDPEDALREHGRLVILGAPGSGKSTLLRYLARQAAQQPDGPIPILVPLGEYAARLSLGHDLTLQAFALQRAAAGDEALRAALDAAVKQQRVLWLVDALDEAHRFRSRAAREAAYLPGQLVLTSRPVGYERPLDLADLPHYEILPLEVDAVQDFLRRWFTVLAERRGEGQDWVAQRVAWLEEQLRQRPRLQPLARNPLMLTFLVLLAGEEPARELPDTRAGLYAAYLRELLLTWEARRRADAGPGELHLGPLKGKAARQAALAGVHLLGWRLHWLYYGGQGAALPTREDLEAFLAEKLPQAQDLPAAERPNLAAAVVAFWEEAGLFTYWRFAGHTFLAFRHLTFQEYGAARVLADLWKGGKEARERAWAFLKPRLHHPAWREVLLLLGTVLADATDLVRRVRTARSPYEGELLRDHALAVTIVGEGARVTEGEIRRLKRALSRPLARWRRVAFWVGYASPLIALFLGGLVWPWRLWPGWAALVANTLWSLGWGLGAWKYGEVARRVLSRFPQLQAWLGWPWRRIALPISAWRVQAVRALAALGPRAIPILVRALGDGDRDVRRAAAWALGAIGPAASEAVPALVRALGDADWRVRAAAARALGAIGPAASEAVPGLVRALGDADSDVREAAARALGALGPAAVPGLVRALGDEDSDVREAAARALGAIGPGAVPALERALRDEDSDVRRAAARALGALGPAAVPGLVRALGDEDSDVREAAARALGAMGSAAARAVPALERILLEEVNKDWKMNSCLRKGTFMESEELLISIPELKRKFTRSLAANVLADIGSEDAVPALIQALRRGKFADVRRSVAKALGKLGKLKSVTAVSALIQTLGDEDLRVRQAAAQALEEIGPIAAPGLKRALTNAHARIRAWAALVLAKLSDELDHLNMAREVARALWWRLTDWDEYVREATYEALGAVVARLTQLEVAQPEQKERWDPLQPQAESLRRQVGRWLAYGLAAVVLLAAGSTLLLLAEPIRDAVTQRLLPWVQGLPTGLLLGLALVFGLLGGGLVALGRRLWTAINRTTDDEAT